MEAEKTAQEVNKNTMISYIYRDACNYKKQNEAVVSGSITEAQIDAILECLVDGKYFIPKQVGLLETRFDELSEDDHCWFELERSGFEATHKEENTGLTVEDVVKAFLAAKNNWEECFM